jgi:hypothetical protein
MASEQSANPNAGELTNPSDFPEEGGPGDTLNPSESADSDQVRNDDGDVVAPPDEWSEADKHGMTGREEEEGASLDDRLDAEEPDVLTDTVADDEGPRRAHRGQVGGTPEDGDSLFDVADE